MKLKIDVTNVAFMVTGAPEAKEYDGKQQVDRETNALKWVTQLLALEQGENGQGEIIRVVTAGEMPKLSQTQPVIPVDLEAIPWSQNGKSGVAYKAAVIKPKPAK
ncbi:hypothetical protein SAMN05216298_2448 [Glycomyces sambucus]|uniref:Uncharacterized protein n=1 Tax=Glycomyces sambucus TaxID=380244 RepID=A0A1G9GV62_9ACTN|nr:hypothetical protein [Glycomyces sambucus]SDL04600.1 hypothetical protein SAMN05216298_2448 [Glycomyces sambucus]